jgi:hypothetical protein
VRADNTRFIVQAARQRSQTTRQRAFQALRELAAEGDPVTFEAVARTAGVSRSWLYGQPDLKAEVERLRTLTARTPVSPPVPARQRASDASLRRRLEAVNAEVRRLREENQRLRGQLAWALGERRVAEIRSQPDAPRNRKRAESTTIGPCS